MVVCGLFPSLLRAGPAATAAHGRAPLPCGGASGEGVSLSDCHHRPLESEINSEVEGHLGDAEAAAGDGYGTEAQLLMAAKAQTNTKGMASRGEPIPRDRLMEGRVEISGVCERGREFQEGRVTALVLSLVLVMRR